MALLTPGDCEEVLPGGAVDLDVALSDVMFVFAQRQIAMFLAVEAHQRLAVAPTLLAQTQSDSAPARRAEKKQSHYATTTTTTTVIKSFHAFRVLHRFVYSSSRTSLFRFVGR